MHRLNRRIISLVVLLVVFASVRYFQASALLVQAAHQDSVPERLETNRHIAYEIDEQILGTIAAIAGRNQIIYAGIGNQLEVISVRSPNHPRKVATPVIMPAIINDLYLIDDRLISLTGNSSISILDVSDPVAPILLGSLNLSTTLASIYSTGTLVFTIDTSNVLYVIDASNPAEMLVLDDLTLPGNAFSIEWLGTYLYASCGEEGIVIVDFSDPHALIQAGIIDKDRDERRIIIVENLGYSFSYSYDPNTNQSNTGLYVIEFSDPVNPAEVGWVGVDAMELIAVKGNYAYLTYFGQLTIVDVSDKQHPFVVSSSWNRVSFLNLLLDGSLGYVFNLDSGLQIFDFKEPTIPHLVGTFQEAAEISALDFQGGYAYLAKANDSRILIIDLSLGGTDQVEASIDIGCYPSQLITTNHYLYVACNDSTLTIFDINKPTKPVRLGYLALTNSVLDMAVSANRLYLLGYQGLALVDTSDPQAPILTSTLVIAAEEVEASGESVYLVTRNTGLHVVDASNPTAMNVVGWLPISNWIYDLAVSHPYVYISAGFDDWYFESSIYVVNVAQASVPEIVGQIDLPPSPAGINLSEGRLLIPHSKYGLLELDLSDPQNPALLNDVTTLFPWPKTPPEEAYAVNDKLVLASSRGGFTILQRIWTDRITVQPDGLPYSFLDGKASFVFPAGSLTGPTSLVNYESQTVSSVDGNLVAGPIFKSLSEDTGFSPTIEPTSAFSLSVSYGPSQLNYLEEETIGLYVLNQGEWVLENGSKNDPGTRTVTASPTHMGTWTVFGTARNSIFLPVVGRNFSIFPDLMVNRLEVTQAVQRNDLSVPLVAERRTVLRVHVSSDRQDPVDDVEISVLASQNNIPLDGSPITYGPWAVFPDPYAGNPGDSFNFSLPSEWLIGNVAIEVQLNPQKTIQEISYLNNEQYLTLAFNSMPPLDYKIVPVDYTSESTGETHPGPTEDTMTADIWRMYPLHQINTSFRLAVPWSGDLSEGEEWNRFLDDLTDIKYSDEAPESMAYYGAVKDPGPIAWGGMGWIGLRSAVGIDSSGTAAHELGHNFGRGHVPCGVDGDEDYPYPDGIIGQWGYDVYTNQAYAPNVYKDFMSYCGPTWVSDYTYLGLYEDQQENGARSSLENTSAGYYWVRLKLEEDGSVSLKPVYILMRAFTLEGESSGYTARLLNKAGELLQSYTLPLQRAKTEAGEHLGVFATLPVPENGAAAIVIEKDGEEVVRQALESGEAQVSRQRSSLVRQPEGWKVSWGTTGAPARVRLSTDGGVNWTTLGLDIVGNELQFAEVSSNETGFLIEVSFANRSLPNRILLNTE